MNDSVIRSFVDLRRNYAAYPFESTMLEADRHKLTEQVIDYLDARSETWVFYQVRELDVKARLALEELELVDTLWLQNKNLALLVRDDHEALICLHGQDHVLIRVAADQQGMLPAVSEAKSLARMLSQNETFAKDERIGWLTARPQFAGTGIQLSHILHLPMLLMMQQMKSLEQKINGSRRFILAPASGDEKNPGALYRLSNSFTAHNSAEALVAAMEQTSEDICAKEDNLRRKVLKYATRSIYLDQIYRAWGILLYARRLTQSEFLSYWSKVRLGARAGFLPADLSTVDSLLSLTSLFKLIQRTNGVLDEHAVHFSRADVVRSALHGGT